MSERFKFVRRCASIAVMLLVESAAAQTAESGDESDGQAPIWLNLIAIDNDLDGVKNTLDAFPNDPSESADFDGDGVGDNADLDDDDDGVDDTLDLFPFNAVESADTDGDGIGDNADFDVDGDGVQEACSVASQKVWVRNTANTRYYWNDELADANIADYSTAQKYLDALVAPITSDGTGRDPGFSYITTKTADEASFTSGAYYGFGFRYNVVAGDFYFADTYEGAPAYEGGLRRGQRLLAIDMGDGYESWESIVARQATNLEVFGPSDEVVTRGFRVNDNGVIRDISVTKAEVTTPPLAGGPMLIPRQNDSPVGYIHFRRFIDSADQPLRDASTLFGQNGVTDLIVDLRYNGGGLLRVADTLLNLLGGIRANFQRSYIVNYNQNLQSNNYVGYFRTEPQSMIALRIAFITRGGTASASELLINSLDPHIEVVLVGDDTYGKAVGQSAYDQSSECETRLRLITFEIQNGLGQGGYYTGLYDSGRFDLCPAADDVTRPFGDVNEDSLATALAWFDGTAVCDGPAAEKSSSIISPIQDSWFIGEPPPIDREGGARSF